MEDVDRLAREPHSIVIGCNWGLNLDRLIDKMWDYLRLTRVYTKKRVSQSAVFYTQEGAEAVGPRLHRLLLHVLRRVLGRGIGAHLLLPVDAERWRAHAA